MGKARYGSNDFANSIFKKNIKSFYFGNMERDFTYIDDVTEFVFRLLSKTAE